MNKEELHVSWIGFHDPESDVRDFYLQLFVGDSCNEGEIGDDHHFSPLSDVRDVRNSSEITFYDYLFEEGERVDVDFDRSNCSNECLFSSFSCP